MKTKLLALVLLQFAMCHVLSAQNYSWLQQIQGSGIKVGTSMAVDAGGNIYVTGKFNGTISFGTTTLTSTTSLHWSGFIARADANLNWKWAQSFDGPDDDAQGLDIAVNSSNGDCYVAGSFKSSVLNFTPTVHLLNNVQSFYNGFVAKYTTNGAFQWAQNIQCSSGDDDVCTSIAVDNANKIYITGYTGTVSGSTTTICGLTKVLLGDVDGFVACLNPTNGVATWASIFGATNANDGGFGITVNRSTGVSYVTGSFSGVASFGNGVTLNGVGNANVTLDIDIFVASYAANGNCVWAIQGGGDSNERGYDIQLDNSNNLYICGYISAPNNSVYGSTTLVSSGSDDVLIAKCNSTGWLWAKRAGSTGADRATNMVVESNGYSYTTGYYNGSITFGSNTLVSSGLTDVFVAKYDLNGNNLWAESGGSTKNDEAWSLAFDTQCGLYLMGDFIDSIAFGALKIYSTPSTVSTYIVQMPKNSAGPDIQAGACCGGNIGTPPIAGATYSWTPITGIIGSTTSSIALAQPSVSTTYTLTTNYNGCISTDQVYVKVIPGTPCCRMPNIDTNEEPITVSPNPTSGLLSIQYNNTNNRIEMISIFNVFGAKVYESRENSDNKEVDISSLDNGIYIIRFQMENGIYVKRVAKQ
jgi:hypothetical protein